MGGRQPDEITGNDILTYNLSDQLGSNQVELNHNGEIVSLESYYPYGGTAVWTTNNQAEAHYKYRRYSGKERDHSGLYYYGYRYYLPWLGRWLNPDPTGISEGLNLFCMANNNPIIFVDTDGRLPTLSHALDYAIHYTFNYTFDKDKNVPTLTIPIWGGTSINSEPELRSFSQTGQLDASHYEIVKNMNPFYACFNCPVTSYKTAYLLEYGELPSLPIYESLPRPLGTADMNSLWPELFDKLPKNKNYIAFKAVDRPTLETTMENLGEGTHAIIGGDSASGIGHYANSGHIFNYVLNKTEEDKLNFSILDAYSPKNFKKGHDNPDKYFSQYNPLLESIIFYNDPKENNQLLKKNEQMPEIISSDTSSKKLASLIINPS